MAEMRARFAQMAQGGGGGQGGMGGGGSRSAVSDGPAIRTVYLIDQERSAPGKPVLQAVSVKTGISDGTNTEIAEGLKEGDVVVTGVVITAATATAATPNPFGGPMGGPPRR
jgi:HlyD family secretion protein